MKVCMECLEKLNLKGILATAPMSLARCGLCGQLDTWAEVPESSIIASVPEVREPYTGPPIRGEP